MRPQRFRKQGTYDEKWQRERWPHFPDDMDYEFFNTAPEDQYLPAYFRGDEAVEIQNMHPDMPVIQSRLPDRRIRCFVTRQKELHSEETVFEEVPTHIDTVWLFPGILRAVVVYRGTTEILDDEYADVRRVFLATEQRADEPETLEHYLEEQRKALDRSVPMDLAPLEAAQKRMADALKRIKALPRDIEEARLRAMGKRPVMKRTPEEMTARFKDVIEGSRSVMAGLETLVAGMQAKHGHRVRIDRKVFDDLRGKLSAMEGRLAQGLASIQKARDEGGKARQEMSEALKQRVSSEDLKKAGIDPDNLLPGASVNPWHDQGFPLVIAWRKNLEQDSRAQGALESLGLTPRTVKRAWLGINLKERREERTSWGLKEKRAEDGEPEPLVLPAGLVLPRFQEAALSAIRVRPGDVSDGGLDALVEGSDETPLFLPSLEPDGAPVVRVKDELEAWLLAQEIEDACSVIALDTPGTQPSAEAGEVLKSARAVLVAVPMNATASEKASWKAAFPDAVVLPLPEGTTLFEARAKGVDLRPWIMDALPREIAEAHRIGFNLPEPGKAPSGSPTVPLPKIDASGMIKASRADLKAHVQPKREEAGAFRAEMEDLARKEMARQGLDYDQEMAKALAGKETPAQTALSFGPLIAEQRERMRGAGQLTPEIESRMREGEALARETGTRLAALWERGATRIEGLKKLREDPLPDWAKKIRARRGLDPDEKGPLTREAVIERHQKGRGFAGRNLSGLDLSGLDLSGIDLSRATCRKTNFADAVLDGATLDQTLAAEADFTGASLKGVTSAKGLFTKAVLTGADWAEADLDKVSFQEATLEAARFGEARLKMVSFQKASVKKAVFSSAEARMCLFPDANAVKALFRNARLEKCVFQRTVLDEADFSGAVLPSTMLNGATGEGVTFAGADLTKTRMGGKAAFPGADFTGATLVQSCFRDAELSGARFRGARMGMAMFEGCDLSRADLFRVPARETRFSRTNLEGADMRGINLFLGSLRKARIVGADLTGSNLYGVDFYKAVFGETRIDDANLKGTQLHNRTEFLP